MVTSQFCSYINWIAFERNKKKDVDDLNMSIEYFIEKTNSLILL